MRHAPAEGPDLTRVSLVPGYRFRRPHLDKGAAQNLCGSAPALAPLAQEKSEAYDADRHPDPKPIHTLSHAGSSGAFHAHSGSSAMMSGGGFGWNLLANAVAVTALVACTAWGMAHLRIELV